MKLSKLYSKSLWKDSFLYAVSFIAAIETICAIANFSITDICNIQKWWEKGLVIVGVFLLFWLIISVVKAFRADHSITLKTKGINVKIEEGDIFESTDWKLIPFNEFFDTTVDDVVIARNSLNGKFIERLQDIDDLKRQINEAEDIPGMKRKTKDKLTGIIWLTIAAFILLIIPIILTIGVYYLFKSIFVDIWIDLADIILIFGAMVVVCFGILISVVAAINKREEKKKNKDDDQ